jgi:penicillin-binding protein 1C
VNGRRGLWAIGCLSVALVGARLALPKPSLWDDLDYSRAVFDRNHRLLRLTLTADEKYRLRVPLAEISPALVEATLLQEDHWYRRHPGINPWTLLQAAWGTYVQRGRRVGGSTIEMQLARMRFGIDSRSLSGKVKQILRAVQLECFYSKDELLEAYLNRVPYGGNVEGVGGASLAYFHKTADRLTTPEALTLAVVPQNPVRRSPAHGADALTQARGRLLEAWRAAYPARPAPSGAAPLVYGPESLPFLAPHFAQAVLESEPFERSLVTTLDVPTQKLLERRLRAYVDRRHDVGIRNAAALLVDGRNMDVLASVGSADFFDSALQGQVDGTRAKRSPGSALKPFIYALAFDQGLAHPRTMLKDAPTSFGGYNPENFDGDFMGPLAAADALTHSRNIPAVHLASRLASPTFYEFLAKAGVSQLRPESDYGLSLVLGSAEMTMEELAGLYALLAHGGVRRPLNVRAGATVPEGPRLLSEEASFMVLDVLEKRGRPGQAFSNDWTRDAVRVAWKTGTSHGFRDAWSMGVFGPYVLAVWVGNFDGTSNPAFVGQEAAAPLLFDIVDSLRSEHPEIQRYVRPKPAALSKVQVCAISGDLPGPHCPHTVATWFIPGRSPIHTCDIHREVFIDVRSGRRACASGPFTRSEVFEFWPSDLQKLFRQAGMPRRLPPGDGEDCSLEERSTRGLRPQITSPETSVSYPVRMASLGGQAIPLAAVADADVRALYWFLDEKFLGQSGTREPFFWTAQPGRYVLRVVDDQGRSDARDFKVTLVQ